MAQSERFTSTITVMPGERVGGNTCEDESYHVHKNNETTFSDDFSGTSVDYTKWSTEGLSKTGDPAGAPLSRVFCSDDGLRETIYMDDCFGSNCNPLEDPFQFGSGKVKIMSQYRSSLFSYTGVSRYTNENFNIRYDEPFDIRLPFSTGGLWSKRGDFKFGRFDIRFKITSVRGAWPAFWLLTTDDSEIEIDVFEFFGTGPKDSDRYKPQMAIHLWPNADRPEKVSTDWDYRAPKKSYFINRYNIFSFERTPSKMTFYVNDRIVGEVWRYRRNGQYLGCGTVNNTNSPWIVEVNEFYTDSPLRLIVSRDIYGNGDEDSNNPAVFTVDYVRLKQKSGPCNFPTFASYQPRCPNSYVSYDASGLSTFKIRVRCW